MSHELPYEHYLLIYIDGLYGPWFQVCKQVPLDITDLCVLSLNYLKPDAVMDPQTEKFLYFAPETVQEFLAEMDLYFQRLENPNG